MVTVHPLACSVAFAVNPVAEGVADVPVIVTVLFEYVAVPLVPSSAASLTSMLSTLAWFNELDVVTKFELTDFNVSANVKDERDADVVGMVIVDVICSNAPKEILVKLDFVPVMLNAPTIFSFGNDNDVTAVLCESEKFITSKSSGKL